MSRRSVMREKPGASARDGLRVRLMRGPGRVQTPGPLKKKSSYGHASRLTALTKPAWPSHPSALTSARP